MMKHIDQDLLFGLLALQMGFVDRNQLVSAVQEWLADKTLRLEDLLLKQEAITRDDLNLLSPLVARHLENHDGDPQKCLATLSSMGSTADVLRSLQDRELTATLEFVGRDQSLANTLAHDASTTSSAKSTAADNLRFRILRPHAKGGLGEVSVARDTELNREVALKEIQSRFADDESSRSRFLLEAEVTGGLEHPGIVPVYGLGRYDDGRPFYAMRFIQGDSLQEAADRFHAMIKADGAEPRSQSQQVAFDGVEFRKLIGRLIDVCLAIEYAHSRGVLHRDLKPGNIMLGKYGETLVVDWGLAKPQGQEVEGDANPDLLRPASASGSAATMMGSALGTPAFMPPEQADGRLDSLGPASDVYSLGATLYYLLSGGAPFSGKDVRSLLEDVRAGSFPPPRTRQPQAPKPLEAVCLKAMALRPEDRYATPQALADDLERYLADEPTSAYAEPVRVRARRWVRKHQTLTASTAAVILVTLVGLGIFSTVVSGKNAELVQLNASLDQKNTELTASKERETVARLQAEDNERVARQQSQLALTTLTRVIQNVQSGLKNLPGGGDVRRRLLATSLEKLNEVSSQYVAKTAVDRATMRALLEMGDIVRDFGTGESPGSVDAKKTQSSAAVLANSLYSRALEIGEALATEDTNDLALRRTRSLILDRLTRSHLESGRISEALARCKELEAAVVELNKAAPDSEQDQVSLASAHVQMGDILLRSASVPDAMSRFHTAEDLLAPLLASDPEDLSRVTLMVTICTRLGEVALVSSGTRPGAEYFRQALTLQKRVVAAQPDDVQQLLRLANCHKSIGDAALAVGDLTEARENYRSLQTTIEDLLAIDPSSYKALQFRHIAFNRLGLISKASQDWESAYTFFHDGKEAAEAVVALDPDNREFQRHLAIAYQDLGDTRISQARWDEGIAFHEQRHTITAGIAAASPNDTRALRDLSISNERLGQAHLFAGRVPKAIPYLQSRLEIAEKLASGDPTNSQFQRDLGIGYEMLGSAYKLAGRIDDALKLIDKAFGVAENSVAADPSNANSHRDLAVQHLRRGGLHEGLDDFDAAIKDYKAGAAILRHMIAQGMNVEKSQRELRVFERAAARAELGSLALEDWDRVLESPVDILPGLLRLRAVKMVQKSKFDEAAQAAEKLVGLDNADQGEFYDAACTFARCSASLEGTPDKPLSDEQRKQRVQWNAQGIAALKKAIAAGWTDFDHMRTDSDLAALHDLPEFQSLVPPPK